MIISGGENISSVEVEGVLLRHPAVQEVAIVGLPHEKWGEAPHAFVVLQAGRHARPRTELVEFARERLAHFKAPHRVTFVHELPKTATGKIQKYVPAQGGRGRSPAVTNRVRAVKEARTYCRRDGDHAAVIAAHDLPAALVHHPVMPIAEQGEVRQIAAAAADPMHQVMS